MSELKRRFPRFLNTAPVELRLEDGQTRPAFMTDISRGGLFVKLAEALPLHSRLVVAITSPQGTIELAAEVMHVVDEVQAQRTGRDRGLGLQFVDIGPGPKPALDRYIEEVANRMEDKAMAQVERAGQAVVVMSKAAAVLQGIAAEDLYAALSLSPSASDAEISIRLKDLSSAFASLPATLTPGQRTRAEAASAALRGISALLTDSERRRDYDQRHGHTRND